MTRYVIVRKDSGAHSVNQLQPLTGVRHRTINAAVRADDKIQRRCVRANGHGHFVPTQYVAEEHGSFRRLTEAEAWEVTDAVYSLY